ncbi:MAG: hypothetical protein KKE30_18995 [Gammaproteobacteria bacterium]|nr:hypothetical protein [Gammaproteobacteria bacterium]MBU1555072.1 hypothetical protein [Gammaproteobacteria bacterium]MBU2072408.1 hypothetical protein [Gammaproteobacteria bacterium]MBU2183338.1 hypothetical protein [Gammaproteobacteria bacterium]MBU2203125.1 hypothetical protein [Gammaproteobacteria bacterium]
MTATQKALFYGFFTLFITTVCLFVFYYQAMPNKEAYKLSFCFAFICVVFLYKKKQFRENLKTRSIISSNAFLLVLFPIQLFGVALFFAFFIALWTTLLWGENAKFLTEVVDVGKCGPATKKYTCIDLKSTEGDFSAVRLEERYKNHVMIGTKVVFNVDRSPLGYKVNSVIPLFDLKPN